MADMAPISPMNIQLDPTISLKGVSAAPAGGGLGQLSMPNMLDMATRMNQLRLSNQEFGARRAAGQIIAGAPDLDTGVQRLAQDPNVVGFAAPIMNEIRTAQETLQRLQGLKATQSREAFAGAMHGMLGAIDNPHQLESLIQTQMALMPPDIQRATLPAMQGLLKSLNDQLPKDPAAAQAEYTRRMTALVLGSGVTPEAIRGMTGQLAPQLTKVLDNEGREIPGIVGGPVAGGQGTGFRPLTMPGAPAPAGSTAGAPIAGPSIEQAEYRKQVGLKTAEQQEEFAQNAGALPVAISKNDLLMNALEKFQSGGGASMRLEFGKALQGLKNAGIPVPQILLDAVANNSLTDSDVFNNFAKQFAVGVLKDSTVGTGKVMKSEVDEFMKIASMTTDPAALMRIFNQGRKALQIGLAKATGFPEFKRKLTDPKANPELVGLNAMDYLPWFTEHFDESKLPQRAGSMDLSQRPESNAAGAVPTTAMKWDPVTHDWVRK